MRSGGRGPVAMAVALSAGSAVLFALSGGSPVLALAPWVLAGGVLAVLRQPLHRSVLALIFLVLIAEAPQDRPADGLWRSPLFFLGQALLTNFNQSLGVSFAPFSGLDLTLALLAAVALARGAGRDTAGAPGPLWGAAALALVALVAWAGWGLARGGEPGPAYWQLRQLIYLPLLSLLMLASLRSVDLESFQRLVVGAALVKVVVGSYFYFAVALPGGLEPAYVTTHADTLLFVGAALLPLARWLHAPSRASLRQLALLLPPLLLGLFLNDRRLAYLGLAAGAGVLFLLAPWTGAKRLVLLTAVVSAPLGGLYVAAGWSSEAAVFKPVAVFRTMLDPDNDSSTQARDIENYNLAQTIIRHPLVGTGFGHPYGEFETAADLSELFGLYHYIPHNSVLWLLAIGGVFGFLALWSPVLMGTALAARAGWISQVPRERAHSHWLLCLVLLFTLQLWGDMGSQCWTAIVLISATVALSGKRAVALGAWSPLPLPSPLPLLRSVG